MHHAFWIIDLIDINMDGASLSSFIKNLKKVLTNIKIYLAVQGRYKIYINLLIKVNKIHIECKQNIYRQFHTFVSLPNNNMKVLQSQTW